MQSWSPTRRAATALSVAASVAVVVVAVGPFDRGPDRATLDRPPAVVAGPTLVVGPAPPAPPMLGDGDSVEVATGFDAIDVFGDLPHPVNPDGAGGPGPHRYGDDPALDELWAACEAGSGAACDELFERAPLGSDYEAFGLSCGERPSVLDCTVELDEVEGGIDGAVTPTN